MSTPIHVSHRSLLLLLAISIVMVPVTRLRAQEAESSVSAPDYDLPWWTVDGGGSTEPAASSSYSLVGTIGQADAGEMVSSRYGFVGGFWALVSTETGYRIYLPLVVRNTP